MSRLIAVMPVKNEAWILPRTLAALSLVCDEIVVADQFSIDETRQICARFPKVELIDNPSLAFNEGRRRQILLDAARQFSGNNLILAIDADEIPTATALTHRWKDLLQERMNPGESAILQWVMLWGSPRQFREDSSVWSNSWKHFIYRDDRKLRFNDSFIHLPRVPESTLEKSVRIEDIKVLHFQFVVFARNQAKQRWYRVQELLKGNQPDVINRRYIITKDERAMQLAPVPDTWLAGWLDAGIELADFPEADLYWHEVEILRYFAQYDVVRFAELDIWDVDWEQKRRLALDKGEDGMPAAPIQDPRSMEQRLYHAYLHRNFATPPWRRPDEVKVQTAQTLRRWAGQVPGARALYRGIKSRSGQ